MHFSMKYNQTQMFWRSAALFLFGCVVLALLTFVSFRLHATDAIAGLLYLVVVVLISLQGRLVPALLIAITALCCLNYYFTRPLYELTLVDPLDFVALATFVTSIGRQHTGVQSAQIIPGNRSSKRPTSTNYRYDSRSDLERVPRRLG